jgi:hypothetical protein
MLKKPAEAKPYFQRFLTDAPSDHPSRPDAERYMSTMETTPAAGAGAASPAAGGAATPGATPATAPASPAATTPVGAKPTKKGAKK